MLTLFRSSYRCERRWIQSYHSGWINKSTTQTFGVLRLAGDLLAMITSIFPMRSGL
jgi:hypothetical protein